MLYAQEDPNVMWTYKDASFSTYPAIHPNGNVLIGDRNKADVIELNGLTGELIRRISVPVSDIDPNQIAISKDGTRLTIAKKVVDYATGEVIAELPEKTSKIKFLHPDNNQLVIRLYNQKEYSWIVWNINEETSKGYKINTFVTSIDVSNDGRFLAVASLDGETQEHTHFYLYDAQTMKLIRELEDVPAEGRTIEFIQFSENAKYVGYGQLTGGKPKATFFSCESPYQKWEFHNSFGENFHSLGFINDEYVFMSGQSIRKIVNSDEIYFSNKYISNYPLYNSYYKSIMVWDNSKPTLVALDFNKILNSVGINEPNDPIQKIITEYRKGILKISGIESILPIINLTINDIKGNLVYQNRINHIKDIIEIPVQLQNGVYLLHIQDMNKSHTAKFLVLE
ncbi:hypothetical protein MASR1M45_13890 [Candidatus Kapaibacterium sp.]